MRLDFEGAGLLDGLESEQRGARLQLLQMLADEGVTLDELRAAVSEGRLALLPVERVLSGGEPRYTCRELSERCGLELEFVVSIWRSLGVAIGDVDELVANDEDLEALHAVRRWRDAGVSEDGLHELARAMRHGLTTVAGAMRSVLGASFVQRRDSELDVALRYAEVAEEAAAEADWLLGYVLRVHQRAQLALEVTGTGEVAGSDLPGARHISVCFADLVGFTALGERSYAPEIAAVAARLDALTAQAVCPPVQFVKSIGDAVMLVSPHADPLIETALDLNRTVAEDASMPRIRVGMASGPALAHAGDWFGQPVNLASRLTGLAAPGQVLVSEDIRHAAKGAYRWTARRRRHIKGLDSRPRLFSVEPADEQ